jgi:hypothetical protein
MSAADGFVPDMGRRGLMNGLLLGSIAGPVLVLPAVLISYLVPAKAGGGGGGIHNFLTDRNSLGAHITFQELLPRMLSAMTLLSRIG